MAYSKRTATELTQHAADILNEVRSSLVPVVIVRHKKPVAFLAHIDLLAKLEPELATMLEDRRRRIGELKAAIENDVAEHATGRKTRTKSGAPREHRRRGR
jgi:PHD/YefM family antitoxin component YafN of YafNO toxin-antitoxin module